MDHFNNDDVGRAVADHIAQNEARSEREEIDEATGPGRPLDGCNQQPATCERRLAGTTPFCNTCQVRPGQ